MGSTNIQNDLFNAFLVQIISDTTTIDDSLYEQYRPGYKNMSYIPNYNSGAGGGGNSGQQQQQQQQQSYLGGMGQQQHPQPVSALKRKMTLDLSSAKRPRVFSANTPGVVDLLSSPDVMKLNIPTPELDRFIINTTNPNILQTPTSVFFPNNVTKEQELYAKGFEHALKQLHDQDNSSSLPSSCGGVQEDGNSNASSSYAREVGGGGSGGGVGVGGVGAGKQGFMDFSNVVVKEEPQTVPDSYSDDDDHDGSTDSEDSCSGFGSSGGGGGKSILPVDMVSQEKIKLERKRQRNRLAASKCRRKKLERIAKLEDKVKQLKNENNELGNVLVKLRESVQVLKTQVYEHVQAGCPIVVAGGNASNAFS